MLGGALLGGYCLSEADAGSDPAAMRARAQLDAIDGGYRVTGSKAWVTHGGEADFYTLFARTSSRRARGHLVLPGAGHERRASRRSRPSARWG